METVFSYSQGTNRCSSMMRDEVYVIFKRMVVPGNFFDIIMSLQGSKDDLCKHIKRSITFYN